MGDELRIDLDAQALEYDWPTEGGRRALRIEVHGLAGEVLQ